MKTKTKQTIRLSLLFIWGFTSVLVIAGEDIPGHPMGLAEFFVPKTVALASLWLCFRTGRLLKNKGLLPETNEDGEG